MRAASLAAQLPADSRVLRAINPELAWGSLEHLLIAVEHDLRVIQWMFADHKKHTIPFPEPIQFNAQSKDANSDIEVMDADELFAILQRPREAVVE